MSQRFQADSESNVQRGTVTITADNTLCFTPVTETPGDSDEIELSKPQSQEVAHVLHTFLQQKARLFVSPPNKAHITIDGTTIGHTKAAGPFDEYPDGILTNSIETDYVTSFGDQRQTNLDPLEAAIPLACFSDRVLPNIPTCPHCLKQATELGLITTPETPSERPGTPTPDCPYCGNPCEITENDIGSGVTITHCQRDGADCPALEDSDSRTIHRELTDTDVANMTEHRVGLETVTYSESDTAHIRFPNSALTKSDISMAWFSTAVVPAPIQREFLTEADSKTRPKSFVTITHPSLTTPLVLSYRDFQSILDYYNTSHQNTDQPTPPNIPPALTVLNTCNTITATSDSDTRVTAAEISAADLTQSLTPIELTDQTTDTKYDPATVSEKIDEFTTPDGDYDRSEINMETLGSLEPEENIHSRHYHQRLLNYDADSIDTITNRLNITPEDSTILIFGGFTGEFAEAIGELGAEVIFTDPMDAWTEAAADNPHINRVETTPLDTIPADHFADADAVATFECYYGITEEYSTSLYNLLRTAATEHGLLFAVSRPTQTQMEAKKGGGITEFKSQWGILEDVYDMTIRWRQADEVRVWQLKPPQPDDPTIVTDRYTIQALADLPAPTNTTTTIDLNSANADPIPLGDMYDQLCDSHPLLDAHDALAQSLGRLGTVYQSEISSRSEIPDTRLTLGKTKFRMTGPEAQYVDRTY